MLALVLRYLWPARRARCPPRLPEDSAAQATPGLGHENAHVHARNAPEAHYEDSLDLANLSRAASASGVTSPDPVGNAITRAPIDATRPPDISDAPLGVEFDVPSAVPRDTAAARPLPSTTSAIARFGSPAPDKERISALGASGAKLGATSDTWTLPQQGTSTGAIGGFECEKVFCGYIAVEEDPQDLRWDDVEPIMFTTDMDKFLEELDEDDTILTFDGEDVFSSKLPMSSPDVFTAYKRVDRKVKPVPAVFPEDA
ncbi:hypothetical protein PsYK624_135040 [Phanerochaete sordida]|uniref:Uncharacterized protein n=1 Tax=Phanerochaete sordida TaxID=48140 RepID=A0A9P3LJG2_9APHY|nr:hypothetical protein PsYK624_135040 [Phanerochaete sordida]